jgi:hypothetical protein
LKAKQSKAIRTTSHNIPSPPSKRKPRGILPVAEMNEEAKQYTVTATPRCHSIKIPSSMSSHLGFWITLPRRGSEVPLRPREQTSGSTVNAVHRKETSEVTSRSCIRAQSAFLPRQGSRPRHSATLPMAKYIRVRRLTSGEPIVARVGMEMPRLGA